jgi:hypothetical protein
MSDGRQSGSCLAQLFHGTVYLLPLVLGAMGILVPFFTGATSVLPSDSKLLPLKKKKIPNCEPPRCLVVCLHHLRQHRPLFLARTWSASSQWRFLVKMQAGFHVR